ncbi:MAG TPA: hypothetical protein EYG18_07050 [Micavibrio sp.]|nr:hypothetical protein [Pseudomonadota bacterium]MEC8666060.1 hypothetical protein [Pseudomonadota bacterium]HIF25092.1 hypothetical protein [Micavibrio sp.]HIL29009.1 hypothetical protein [Micavibrio sp.]
MKKNLVLVAMLSLALTGCVNREQADVKLGNACKAAVNEFLGDGMQIDRIESIDSSPSPVGNGYRHVTLHTITVDGWLEEKNQYECTFEESFGFMKMGYTASFYQLRIGEQMIGKSGNDIVGSAQDFMKITDAVREALYE